MSEVNDVLRELVVDGCIVEILDPETIYTCSRAEIRDKLLVWAVIDPQDQHDVHFLDFTKVKIEHNRDLAFYRRGKLAAYIAPHIEANLPDLSDYLEHWTNWKNVLVLPGVSKAFDEFWEDAS